MKSNYRYAIFVCKGAMDCHVADSRVAVSEGLRPRNDETGFKVRVRSRAGYRKLAMTAWAMDCRASLAMTAWAMDCRASLSMNREIALLSMSRAAITPLSSSRAQRGDPCLLAAWIAASLRSSQ